MIFITLLLTALTVRLHASGPPIELLRQMGFSVFTSPVINFELKDLDGADVSLESYRGKWIFITFWATWCGPCRTEMPSLEGLYQEFKDENFAVLGVSIDTSGKAGVKKFVRRGGLTFPILLDDQNVVASKYRASSVPSMYVISPDWKLVGLFRGAANWESSVVLKNLKKLITYNEVKDLPKGQVSGQGGGAVDIPKDLVPPKVEIHLQKDLFTVGEVVPLEVLVSWEGDARQYVLKTPKLILPDGVSLGLVSSSTSSNILKATLRYKFPLTIEKSGEYSLGPVELSYKSRSGGAEQFSRASVVKITVEKGLVFAYLYTVILPAGALMVLLIVGGAVFYKRAKKRNNALKENASQNHDFSSEIQWVFASKMNSKGNQYEVKLLELYLKIIKDKELDEQEQDKVTRAIEQTRYAGHRISSEEISYYEKNVKKLGIYDDEEDELED